MAIIIIKMVENCGRVISSKQKSDSIAKLYDMDDTPDRKVWLDKLIGYMEERRTPITACPTISKQALDLYRLYLYVKERGGFVEVCKVGQRLTREMGDVK